MSVDTMIDIRFGGDIATSNENLERVTELILRARAARVRASIDSNFIIQLIQEVLQGRDQDDIDLILSSDEPVDLEELLLSSGYSDLDPEAMFVGEDEIAIPIEVEEFTLSDFAEGETITSASSGVSADIEEDEDEEDDELEEEDLIAKNPPPKRKKKVYARNDGYWLDNRTNRVWSMFGLVLVIVASVIFCISYV